MTDLPGAAGEPDGSGIVPPQPPPRKSGASIAPIKDWLRRFLGPIRIRLVGLILVAAIPLLLLSGTIAWQNYKLALDQSGQEVERLRESAIARHEAAFDGAQQMLQALSQMPDLLNDDAGRCHDRLAGVLDLQMTRYSNIAFFDRHGALHCVAKDLATGMSSDQVAARNALLFQAASVADGLALGNVRFSEIVKGPVIPAAYPVHHGGAIVGYLYTGLRMDWFTAHPGGRGHQTSAIWLVDQAGAQSAIAGAAAAALPDTSTLARLMAGPAEADGVSRGRISYAYAYGELPDGYHILIAYPAAAGEAAARRVLIERVLQLALFTGLGLAAVAIGTHGALIGPLNALGRKVQDWQRTGNFDSSAIPSEPLEVRALCASFAEAIFVLKEQERKLDEAAEKQALLMREIHHRVKNNLQIVASLLNLQASRIRAPEARAEFAAARDRVRALATLHRHLYSQGELTSITMGSFLTELCGQLFDAMGERHGGRLKLTIEAVDLEMSGDQAVPLSLVVTEAVSNAIKYAFPAGRSGHIGVFLTSDGISASLMIEDDGVGIPAGRVETETGTRDGLGLQLIRGFAKQLKAELLVDQTHGTRYILTIPLVPQAPGAAEA